MMELEDRELEILVLKLKPPRKKVDFIDWEKDVVWTSTAWTTAAVTSTRVLHGARHDWIWMDDIL